ncbi:MAG TPA: WYL domain-containing protein [Bacillota bacterium]|nr:WYL domain-containing protein [Bacillota bacterium]
MHRIHWIDAQIRASRYPNARIIAEHFEISQRQAARDIEYLRYTMGAPLAFAAEHNGYYYQDQAYALPALMMTRDDQESLSYLAVQYRAEGSKNAARLANLFERLIIDQPKPTGSGNVEALPVIKIDDLQTKTFGILQKAINQRYQVIMRYMNNKNEVHERVFSPYKLFTRQGLFYVVGFCEMRQEIRVFRIDRIKKLNELETTYQVKPEFNPDEYGESMSFRMRMPYVARVHFTSKVQLKILANAEFLGENTYQIPFYDSKTLMNELLSQPSEFSIISPTWLRERFLNRLQKLVHANLQG